ncbi:hypothetical protein D3C81_1320620 [compost metagenome]
MMDLIAALFSMFALPAALYFIAMLVIGHVSRLAFDALAVLSFMLLLCAWLASSGLDALVMFVLTCAHAALTSFARSRLQVRRSWRRGTEQADGGG